MSLDDRDWYREEMKKKMRQEAADAMWEEVEHSHNKEKKSSPVIRSYEPNKSRDGKAKKFLFGLLGVIVLAIYFLNSTGLMPVVKQYLADIYPKKTVTYEVPETTEVEPETAIPETEPESTESSEETSPAHGTYYRVNVDNLNVRDAATRKVVIGTLSRGAVIEEAGPYTDEKWILFTYEGQQAVVYKEYLELSEEEAETVEEIVEETEESIPKETETAAKESRSNISFGDAVNALTDNRKSDLSKIDYNKTCYMEFSYTRYDGYSSSRITYEDFPVGAYEYYSTLARYGLSEWSRYLADEYNKSICDGLANCFKQSASSDFEAVTNAISFVQSLDYIFDGETDYPKYPIETLYERGGDCEDTALLLCGIIHSMGYGSALIVYEDHCAVGLLGNNLDGASFTVNGNKYFYTETTGTGWKIGEIPDEYRGRSARIIEIK